MADGAAWTLRDDGAFRLIDAEGTVHPVPYRKVGELLELLAGQPSIAHDRSELAKKLWPDSLRAERLTNLRQCLTRIRQLLPEDAVFADRSRCGLRPTFRLVLEVSHLRRAQAAQETGFAQLALWFARNDPSALFRTLRAEPETGLGMDKHVLTESIRQAQTGAPLTAPDRSWARFFESICILERSVPEAATLLRQVTREAEERHDWMLFQLAAFWYGATLILLNDLARAQRIAESASALAAQRLGHPSRRLEYLKAHVLLHRGGVRQAIRDMESLQGIGPASALEQAANDSLRALYYAFANDYASAHRLLRRVDEMRVPAEISTGSSYRDLAAGMVAAADSGFTQMEPLEELAERFAAAGESHMQVYAREAVALGLARRGKRREAAHPFSESCRLRSKIRLPYTGWDRDRLGELKGVL